MKILLKEHTSKIRAIIRKMTGSYNEDLEQDIYVKVLENMPDKYQEEGKFPAWIRVVASNVCLDYFKSSRHKLDKAIDTEEDINTVLDDSSNQEVVFSLKQRQRFVLKAVNNLPSKMRKVVQLYEFEDKSYEDIAKKLGVSVGTVKSRLFNARKILESELAFLREKI